MNIFNQKMIEQYVGYIKKTAEHFVRKGNKVFFHQDLVVDDGEVSFGLVYVLGTDADEEFIPKFLPEIILVKSIKDVRTPAIEITLENLDIINLQVGDRYC